MSGIAPRTEPKKGSFAWRGPIMGTTAHVYRMTDEVTEADVFDEATGQHLVHMKWTRDEQRCSIWQWCPHTERMQPARSQIFYPNVWFCAGHCANLALESIPQFRRRNE